MTNASTNLATTGIAVSEPTMDSAAVRRELERLRIAYPGEFFVVTAGPNDTLVLSWLPRWYLPYALNPAHVLGTSLMRFW